MGLIRFLLACSVVIVHSSAVFGVRLIPGFSAVQAFYIISGFFIALTLNEKYSSNRMFFLNRFLRIFPPYWVITALIILTSLIFGIWLGDFGKLSTYIDEFKEMRFQTMLILIGSNLLLIGQDALTFFQYDESSGLLLVKPGMHSPPALQGFMMNYIAWTVSLELLFYLTAPLYVRSIWRILIVIVIGIAIRLVLFLIGVDGAPWIYRFYFTEIIFFASGCLAYWIYVHARQITNFQPWLGWIMYLVVIFWIFAYPIIPGLYAKTFFLYLLVFISLPFSFKSTSRWKMDKYLGELTYPIYLGHPLIMMIVQANRFPKYESVGTTTLFFTLVFAVILYIFFIKPIDTYRVKNYQHQSSQQ